MTQETNDSNTPGIVRVDRPVRRLRVAATIVLPLLLLTAGVGVAALVTALTRLLEKFFAGNATMVLLVVACLGYLGWKVWNWPEWRRDEDA